MKRDKEKLEFEKKVQEKAKLERMAEFVANAEKKEAELIAKARKAKKKNDKQSYTIACQGLANIIMRKNTVERMLLTKDILITISDVSEMTKEFISSMLDMSKQISSLTKNIKYAKAGKEFSKAMADFDQQNAEINNLLDDVSLSMESADTVLPGGLMKDIEAMIDADAVADEEDLDKAIEKKLERLRGGNRQ